MPGHTQLLLETVYIVEYSTAMLWRANAAKPDHPRRTGFQHVSAMRHKHLELMYVSFFGNIYAGRAAFVRTPVTLQKKREGGGGGLLVTL